jgi:threonine dehydrogenase-like Zn-dependent dehydrogenase
MASGQTHMIKYMKPLLDRVSRGEIDPSEIISHRVRLDDAPTMYKVFRNKEDHCVKVVMDPWAERMAA